MDSLKNFLTEIADEIRVKREIEDKIVANDFASEIGSIEVAEGPISKDVDFIDYDGTLLYSYTLDEIQNMTELPPLPTQEGLICQEWNWSLEDIKAHNRRLIVGATYITDDGKTRIYIELTSEERLEMPLCFRQTVSHGVEIDWGDGSPIETVNSIGVKNLSHFYESTGKYIITLNPIGNCILTLSRGSTNDNIIGPLSTTNKRMNWYYSTTIKKVYLGKNITTLDRYTFYRCVNLSEITIPKNVIGELYSNFFYECVSLTGIVLPNSIDIIGMSAFSYDYELSIISIPNGITYIKGSAFTYCSSLKEIIIPNNVTKIDESALSSNGLRKIIIPNNVTELPSRIFNGCSYLSDIVLPDDLTSIGDYAFSSCRSLEKITIPKKVTYLGHSAFSSCRTFKEIIIPDTVIEPNVRILDSCYDLVKVILSNNMTIIDQMFFYNCYCLTEIVIPSSVLNIGNQAFYNCYSMKKYDFSTHTQVPILANTNVFYNIQSDCQIIVPDALYDEWIAATNWSDYADYIVKVSEVES